MVIRKIGFLLAATTFITLSLEGSAQAGQCTDPWITKATKEVTGALPTGSKNSGDCNINKYNNGKWNSYNELLGYVKAAHGVSSHASTGSSGLIKSGSTGSLLGGNNGGKSLLGNGNNGNGIISHDAGSLIGHDGASLIGHDGASVVGTAGGSFQGR